MDPGTGTSIRSIEASFLFRLRWNGIRAWSTSYLITHRAVRSVRRRLRDRRRAALHAGGGSIILEPH